jgi:hypothetical protein
MQNSTPFKIVAPFPYLKKSQQNGTEQESESRPISLYCEPVDLAGGLIQVVGRRQSQVL